MKGLIIMEPWIDLILEGKKIWEIRGSNTKIRGRVALIKSGTGLIYGTVEIIDSIKLTTDIIKETTEKHMLEGKNLDKICGLYKKPHAWVMQNPVLFDKPIPYIHPQGAVIWVNLKDDLLIA